MSNGSALEYMPEILKLCRSAEEAGKLYRSSDEQRDDTHIWDARARAYEKECEAVGAYYVEIARICDGYRRAVWFLQDIAAMGKKVGSETAAHALAQLHEPRIVDPEEREAVQ